MGQRIARRALLVLALMAAALIGPADAGAHAEADDLESAAPSATQPVSLLGRARFVGAEIAAITSSSLNWTQANLSPSAIKARSREAAATARSRWMSALFSAQCELESTLGLFEVASVDAQGQARWQRIPVNRPLPDRIVLLIHGLDDPGNVWIDAAPAIWLGFDPAAPPEENSTSSTLSPAGIHVVRFDYPNDQSIRRSADLLDGALRELRAAGAREVDIVAHSMGGLIARDAISRPAAVAAADGSSSELPRVPRLILLGTPNRGSYLAHLRWVMEFRDCLERFWAQNPRSWSLLLTGMVDGDGQAGADLLPGSDYLNELNAREPLRGTQITIVEGDFSSGYERQALGLLESLGSGDSVLGCIGSKLASWTRAATGEFGDGAVPVWSTSLDGVDDHVFVEADHRSMITRLDLIESVRSMLGSPDRRPPAIAIVLDRLARPAPGPSSAAPQVTRTSQR